MNQSLVRKSSKTVTFADEDGKSKPALIRAGPPFDDPKADVVLLSSNGICFLIHKLILTLVSPVFRDKFTLLQGDNTSPEGETGRIPPFIPLSERGRILVLLLSWCDPRCIPISKTIEDFQLVLLAAEKYKTKDVINHVVEVLKVSTHIEKEPLTIYAIAIRYKLEGIARMAAKHTLRLTLEERPNVPQLRIISGTTILHLQEYHFACGRAARQVATGFAWINDLSLPVHGYRDRGECTTSTDICIAGGLSAKVPTWWVKYMAVAGELLYKRPCSATIIDIKPEEIADFKQVSTCSQCGPRWYPALREFNKSFAAEVERAVAQVSLVVEF